MSRNDLLDVPQSVIEGIFREHITGLKTVSESRVVGYCPWHDDTSGDSWSADPRNGKWLCFAGCGGGGIVSFLAKIEGLTLAEARVKLGGDSSRSRDWPQEPPEEIHKQTEPEAVYHYRDPDGEPVFRVIRYPGKRFTQQAPDGNGGWRPGVKGVDRSIPYRLPELLAGADQVVYLCEGEKDADAAVKAGALGTTLAGGADAWKGRGESAAVWLEGLNIVAVPDKDTPGTAWAERVQEHLGSAAGSLRFAHASTGKDLYDHLAAGHSLDQLVSIDDSEIPGGLWQAPAWPLSDISQWLVTEPPTVDWLIPERVAVGDRCVIAGPSGSRKSWITLDLAISVACGSYPLGMRPKIGWMPRQGPVLVVDEENPPSEVWRRLRLLAIGRGEKFSDIERNLILTEPSSGLTMRSAAGQAAILRLVRRVDPLLVILDSITGIGNIDNDNDAGQVRRFFDDQIRPLTEARDGTRFSRTVVCVHHANKSADKGDRVKDVSAFVRGSGDYKGAVDSMLVTLPRGRDITTIRPAKVRRGPLADPWATTIESYGGGVILQTQPLEDVKDKTRKASTQTVALRILGLNTGRMLRAKLVAVLPGEANVSSRTASRAIADLETGGLVNMRPWTEADGGGVDAKHAPTARIVELTEYGKEAVEDMLSSGLGS